MINLQPLFFSISAEFPILVRTTSQLGFRPQLVATIFTRFQPPTFRPVRSTSVLCLFSIYSSISNRQYHSIYSVITTIYSSIHRYEFVSPCKSLACRLQSHLLLLRLYHRSTETTVLKIIPHSLLTPRFRSLNVASLLVHRLTLQPLLMNVTLSSHHQMENALQNRKYHKDHVPK